MTVHPRALHWIVAVGLLTACTRTAERKAAFEQLATRVNRLIIATRQTAGIVMSPLADSALRVRACLSDEDKLRALRGAGWLYERVVSPDGVDPPVDKAIDDLLEHRPAACTNAKADPSQLQECSIWCGWAWATLGWSIDERRRAAAKSGVTIAWMLAPFEP